MTARLSAWRKALAVLLILVWLIPIAWMLWGALVPYDYFIHAVGGRLSLGLSNFEFALSRKDWGAALVSTVIVSGVTTVTVFSLAIPAAYALVRWPRRASSTFLFLLSTRILPPAATLIAYVIVFQALGLMNTWCALILTGIALQLGFFCVLLAVNLSPFDRSLEQWLLSQGATPRRAAFQALWVAGGHAIPLLAVLLFLTEWNEYFYSAAFSGGGSSQTLAVVVAGFITGQDVKWGPMFAGCTMSIAPALLLAWLFERSLTRGYSIGTLT